MKIGGLEKLSLIDYPGKISAVVFTIGCNFRCVFCHNPELVLPECYSDEIPEKEIMDFLQTRIGKIPAVVVTGGEPTLHKDLPLFFDKIKSMGFETKLDTNGTNPAMLKDLLSAKLIDCVAMDIKTVREKYSTVCGTKPDMDKIAQSIDIIKASGIEHIFRTTIVKSLHSFEDLKQLRSNISRELLLQKFECSNKDILNKNYGLQDEFTDVEFNELTEKLK